MLNVFVYVNLVKAAPNYFLAELPLLCLFHKSQGRRYTRP